VLPANTGDLQDDEQQDQDADDDPRPLHPAGHGRGRSTVGPCAGVGVAGRVGHAIPPVHVVGKIFHTTQFTRRFVYDKSKRRGIVIAYTGLVPKLWNETIEAHRHAVREAILEAAWALVNEHGLLSVTMSQIAEKTGIGRATLYKYFPDVEAILVAHHDRHVTGHLEHLAELRDQPGDAGERLEAVLEHYALICHHRERHGTEELSALLHRREHVAHAQQQLASYCLHALTAAGNLPSEAAVRRVVAVTLAGLRPPS